MEGNNWRPAASQGEPAFDSTSEDWRSQLHPDARQRIVNKIMETLKRHLPISGPEGIKKIAVRFEEKIYTAATNQSDYLRRISVKMLSMESKTQGTVATNSSPSNLGVVNSNPANSEIGTSSRHPFSPEAGETEIVLPSFKIGATGASNNEWWETFIRQFPVILHSTAKAESAEAAILKEEVDRLRREADDLRRQGERLHQANDILKGEKDSLRDERDSLLKDKDQLTESLHKSQAELLDSKAEWDSYIDRMDIDVKMYADGLVRFSDKLTEYKGRLTALGEAVTPDNSPPHSLLSGASPAQDPALDPDHNNIGP